MAAGKESSECCLLLLQGALGRDARKSSSCPLQRDVSAACLYLFTRIYHKFNAFAVQGLALKNLIIPWSNTEFHRVNFVKGMTLHTHICFSR
jgi:hypothetical protein